MAGSEAAAGTEASGLAVQQLAPSTPSEASVEDEEERPPSKVENEAEEMEGEDLEEEHLEDDVEEALEDEEIDEVERDEKEPTEASKVDVPPSTEAEQVSEPSQQPVEADRSASNPPSKRRRRGSDCGVHLVIRRSLWGETGPFQARKRSIEQRAVFSNLDCHFCTRRSPYCE